MATTTRKPRRWTYYTAAGSAKMERIIAELTGVPPGGMRVSKVQGRTEVDALQSAMTQGYEAYVQQSNNLRQRQGDYTSSYLAEGLDSKDKNKHAHMFLGEVITLGGGNPVDGKTLFDAIQQAETYKAFKTSEYTPADINSKITVLMENNFAEGISQNGGFGKSIADMADKLFRKFIAQGSTLNEAEAETQAFISRNTAATTQADR